MRTTPKLRVTRPRSNATSGAAVPVVDGARAQRCFFPTVMTTWAGVHVTFLARSRLRVVCASAGDGSPRARAVSATSPTHAPRERRGRGALPLMEIDATRRRGRCARVVDTSARSFTGRLPRSNREAVFSPAMLVKVLPALAATLLLAATASAASLPAGTTAILSGTPSLFDALPAPVGESWSTPEAASSDGRYVVFSSEADGLMDGDDDRYPNVYLKDTTSGALELISRRDGPDGGKPSDDYCSEAVISDDGLVVRVHLRRAPRRRRQQRNGRRLRPPAVQDTTDLVSRATGDGLIGDARSYGPSISSDGEYVAFTSGAATLDPLADDRREHVFRRHLKDLRATLLVSRRLSLAGDVQVDGRQPSISASGDIVAYVTTESLDAKDINEQQDVYVRTISSGETVLASRTAGTTGAGETAGRTPPRWPATARPSPSGRAPATSTRSTPTPTRTSTGGRSRRAVATTRRSSTSTSAATRAIARSLLRSTRRGAGSRSSRRPRPSTAPATSSRRATRTSSTSTTAPGPRQPADRRERHRRERGRALGGAERRRRVRRDLPQGGRDHARRGRAPGNVILRDLVKQTTISVSRPPGTDPFVNAGGDSQGAALSADGRFAALDASHFALGLPHGRERGIVVRDRVTGDVILASREDGPDGTPFRGAAHDPDDQRRRAARRVHRHATPPDLHGAKQQVWVRDVVDGPDVPRQPRGRGGRTHGRRRLVRLRARCRRRRASRSSRRAKNLVDGDSDNDSGHLRPRPREPTGRYLASRADGAGRSEGQRPQLRRRHRAATARPRRVHHRRFQPGATATTDSDPDVHVRDLAAQARRASSARRSAGAKSDGAAAHARVDRCDRRPVAFSSYATNLVDGATLEPRSRCSCGTSRPARWCWRAASDGADGAPLTGNVRLRPRSAPTAATSPSPPKTSAARRRPTR